MVTDFFGPHTDQVPAWHVRLEGLVPRIDSECGSEHSYWSYINLHIDIASGEILAKTIFHFLGSTTARDYETVARENLHRLTSPEEQISLLRVIDENWPETESELSGESPNWTFVYATESLDCVTVRPAGGFILQGATDAYCSEDEQPIPDSFMDSDAFAALAAAEGADEIFSEFGEARVQTYAGTPYWLRANDPSYDGRPVWELHLTAPLSASSGDPAAEFRLYVDVVTGEVIYKSSRHYMVGTESASETPETITLDQNYPNPFNPSTTIPFTLAAASEVRVEVFDMTGRRVQRLIDEWRPNSVSWDATGLPSGVYVCRLSAGGSIQNIRMVLLR